MINLKNNLTALFLMFTLVSTYAQLNFQSHTINNSACMDRVYPADIDNDGDLDVFASCFSEINRYIVWYENLDGQGDFTLRESMSSDGEAVTRLYPCDLDGDGDTDLLSASQGTEQKVFWYENTNGLGDFSDRKIIGFTSATPWSISAADIDGDGDLDVIAAIATDDKVVWYENINGQGEFGEEKTITNDAALVWSIYLADIDGDGDMDVLSASEGDSKIAWYENTNGLGTFGSQQIISTEVDGAHWVYSADLDEDGAIDVLSVSFNDGKIAWYENTNGLGSFSEQKIVSQTDFGVLSVIPGDLDGDGDMDLIANSRFSGTSKLVWHENTDGEGNFGDQQIITDELNVPRSIHAIDIDEDVDLDILFRFGDAYSNSAEMNWFENLDFVNTYEYTLSNFDIYPSLAEDFIHLKSNEKVLSMYIYNILGKLELTIRNPDKVDISNLAQGAYFCIVKDKEGRLGMKKILKVK